MFTHITRLEFWAAIILLGGLVIYSLFPNNNNSLEIKKARIEVRDSVLLVQRDSAIHQSLRSELRGDSLQAIINRKNLDLKQVHEKYIYLEKSVAKLPIDSAVAFFLRAISH